MSLPLPKTRWKALIYEVALMGRGEGGAACLAWARGGWGLSVRRHGFCPRAGPPARVGAFTQEAFASHEEFIYWFSRKLGFLESFYVTKSGFSLGSS